MAEDTELNTIADLVAAELQKRQAANNPTQVTQTQSTPGPIKLNILGQEIPFKDQAELEAAITQTFQKTSNENEVLRQQLAKLDPKNSAYVSGNEKVDEFNQEKYIELMGKGSKGILEATDYALNHAIFGGKEPNAAQVIKQAVQESINTKATLAVYQFRERHPEVPLTQDVTKLIDGIRAELRQPFSLEGLEASYGVAQSRGLLPSPQLLSYQKQLKDAGVQLPDTQQNTQQQQLSLGFQPPPTVSRQTQDKGFDLAAAAETMSLQDLEAALRKAGQL